MNRLFQFVLLVSLFVSAAPGQCSAPPGSYCPSPEGSPILCPIGTFSASAGATSCTSCPAGAVAPAGSTACTVCPAGAYAPPGSASCITCPGGTFSASSGAAACTVCPGATYAPPGSTACVNCPGGTVAPAGSSACSACPGGTFAPTGGTSCTSCPAGTFALSGSTACSTCPAGTYAPAGSSACSPCPGGTFATAGGTSCTSCPAGTFAPSGSTACSACPAGTYAPAGSSACILCPGGTFSSDSNSGSCTSCPAGTYAPAGTSACVVCPGGTYAPAGSSACSACPAGTFATAGGTSCSNCPAGTFAPSGSSACSACPAGTYAPAGSSACIVCPGGTFSSASNSGSCTSCPGGTFGPAGSTACNACPAGTYAPPASAACVVCPVGTFTSSLSQSSCQACPAGQTTNGPGATSCIAPIFMERTRLFDESGFNVGRAVAVSADGSRAIRGGRPVSVFSRTGEAWVGEQQLDLTNVAFGVAMDAAGATAGAAYGSVVRFYARTGTTWSQTQSFAVAGIRLAMAPDGNSAVCESTFFKRTAGVWTATALAIPQPLTVNPSVGVALDDAGATVFASGAIFTFSGGVQTGQAPAPGPAKAAVFSAGGSTLLLGNISHGDAQLNQGRVSIYTGGGTTWTLQSHLESPAPSVLGYFGGSLAISSSGDRLVVGAAASPNASTQARYRAFVFQRSNGVYTLAQTLEADKVSDNGTTVIYVVPDNGFGEALALSADGSTLLVGAPNDRATGTGQAYVYRPVTQQFSLTTGVNGPGTVTPSGTTLHDAGSVVTITATPNPGFGFQRYTGDSTSTLATIQMTMNGPKSVNALFGTPTPAFVAPVGAPVRTNGANPNERTWTITVRNTGGTTAENVVLFQPVIELSQGGPSGVLVTTPVGVVFAPALAPGATASFPIHLSTPPGVRLIRLRISYGWLGGTYSYSVTAPI